MFDIFGKKKIEELEYDIRDLKIKNILLQDSLDHKNRQLAGMIEHMRIWRGANISDDEENEIKKINNEVKHEIEEKDLKDKFLENIRNNRCINL